MAAGQDQQRRANRSARFGPQTAAVERDTGTALAHAGHAILGRGPGREKILKVGHRPVVARIPEQPALDSVGGRRAGTEQGMLQPCLRRPVPPSTGVRAFVPVQFGDDIDVHVIGRVGADLRDVSQPPKISPWLSARVRTVRLGRCRAG